VHFGSLHLIPVLYSLLQRGEVAAALARFADNIDWRFRSGPTEARSRRFAGRNRVARLLRFLLSRVIIEQIKPEAYLFRPSHVTVFGHTRLYSRVTRRIIEYNWMDTWSVRGDKVTGLENFPGEPLVYLAVDDRARGASSRIARQTPQ